jgi:hypothetical protein
MQFLENTFQEVVAAHPPPPGGATPPSPYSAHDAIHAAAAHLCDRGATTGDLRAAVYAYNHSRGYVDTVLARAAALPRHPTPRRRRRHRPGSRRRDGRRLAERAGNPARPHRHGGRVTPRMHTLYQALAATGAVSSGATCWDPHLHNWCERCERRSGPDSSHLLASAGGLGGCQLVPRLARPAQASP